CKTPSAPSAPSACGLFPAFSGADGGRSGGRLGPGPSAVRHPLSPVSLELVSRPPPADEADGADAVLQDSSNRRTRFRFLPARVNVTVGPPARRSGARRRNSPLRLLGVWGQPRDFLVFSSARFSSTASSCRAVPAQGKGSLNKTGATAEFSRAWVWAEARLS